MYVDHSSFSAVVLLPSVVAFFLLQAAIGEHGPLWCTLLMFSGMYANGKSLILMNYRNHSPESRSYDL